MEQIKIKINDKEFIIKQSFRALMIFEELTGKNSFQVNESITDVIKLFYCFLKGGNKDFAYSYDEFLDVIDETPQIFEDFTNYLQGLAPKGETTAPKKKTAKASL